MRSGWVLTVHAATGTHERYFCPKSLYTGTAAALPMRSYIAVPRPREVSSPNQSKGFEPMYRSSTSSLSTPSDSPRPVRPLSVRAT